MRINKSCKSFALSHRDLQIIHQAKIDFNEIARTSTAHTGLPPLWSRIPYLMLFYDRGTTTKYFWKGYREFDVLLKSRDNHYTRSYIPKHNGGTRELSVPDWELRHHQHFILRNILYKIPVSQYACAYHKRRGLTDLAEPHIGHDTLIHLDLKDFFSSITEQMVFETLMSETGYPKSVAGYLSRLCCYKHCLPQGACTSPALSNICFKRCDAELATLAKQNGMAYTRYSDDIYLSGDGISPGIIIKEAKRIISQHGFGINIDKTKILGQHQAQMVTAIVVNEKMQVTRKYRRKLRQELYYVRRFKDNATDVYWAEDYIHYLYQLQGRVSFVLYVDPSNAEFIEANQMLNEMIEKYWCHTT